MRYRRVITFICGAVCASMCAPWLLAQSTWAASLTPYTLTSEQLSVLDTNEPVLDVWAGADDSRMVEVFGAVDISAAPEHIWAIMKDCELQKLIIENMKRCEITAQSPTSSADENWDERVQTISISLFLPRVKSEFRTDYTPYREIKITRTGGDLSHLNGVWRLTPTQDGQTRVSYRARLKPKLPVPRKLMRNATAKDMPIVLKNLRDLAQEHQTLADAPNPAVIAP